MAICYLVLLLRSEWSSSRNPLIWYSRLHLAVEFDLSLKVRLEFLLLANSGETGLHEEESRP